MDPRRQLDRFLAALRQVEKGPPKDLVRFLRDLPEPEETLPPWEAWCLIGLVQYLQRKIWAAEILRTRLMRDPVTPRNSDRFQPHPKLELYGEVPGIPEWRYDLRSGYSCRFINKIRAETIEVDLRWNLVLAWESSEYFFYLQRLRDSEPVEKRLQDLFWHLEVIEMSVVELQRTKAIAKIRPSHGWLQTDLSNQVMAYQVDFDFFRRCWLRPESRIWLSALIGDWVLADSLAIHDPAIRDITSSRKESLCRIRREKLIRMHESNLGRAIYNLADIGGGDEVLAQGIQDPSSAVNHAALMAMLRRNDPRWCPEVHAYWSRIQTGAREEIVTVQAKCWRLFLEHDYTKKEVVSALSQVVDYPFYEAALLAMRHAPEQGLRLVRRGLRSPYFWDRYCTAVTVVVLGKSWCKQELALVLEESNNLEKTREIRCAIKELGDQEFLEILWKWEGRHAQRAAKARRTITKLPEPELTAEAEEEALHSWAEMIPEILNEIEDQIMLFRHVELVAAETDRHVETELRIEPSPPRRPWWRFWQSDE